MNLLDNEVLAVITALITIASILSVINIFHPENPQPYTAIALLDQDCASNNYPKQIYNEKNVTLCIYLENHLDQVALFQIRYKLVTDKTLLPNSSSPSPEIVVKEWNFLLDKYKNISTKLSVPIHIEFDSSFSKEATLVFELWILDSYTGEFMYTGQWVHLHVLVYKPVIGGS